MSEHTPKVTTEQKVKAESPVPTATKPAAPKESEVTKLEKSLAKAKEGGDSKKILECELALIKAKSKDRKDKTKDPELLRAIDLEEEIYIIHATRKANYIKESNELAKDKTIFGTFFGWIGLETRNAFGMGADMASEAVRRTHHGILAGLHGMIKGMKESAVAAKDKIITEAKLAKSGI